MSTIVRAILDASSVAVHRYQALSGVPGSETYTLATTGAVTSAGVGGVALENAAPGASFSMQIDGTIPSAMSAGNYAFVTTDASGNLTRLDHWAEDCFGVVDTTGVVTLTATGGGASGTNPSATYTAHGAIAQYAAVCSFATGVLQQATPALLLAGAELVGVASAAVSNGGTFLPILAGLSLTVTGLGAGGANVVTLNATGGLIAGDYGGYVVGKVTSGDVLTVSPDTPHKIAPTESFALALYGGIPNDWTQCVNNNTAWDAMMTAISPFNPAGMPGANIYLKDTWYFAFTPRIKRQVLLQGTGSAGFGNAQIITPPGMPVLALDSSQVSSDGGTAFFSVVEHLGINAQLPPIVGARGNLQNVTAGTHYSLAGETRYILQALTTGVTASSAPAGLTPGGGSYAPKGDVPNASGVTIDAFHVTDGGVTWRWIAKSYDVVKTWVANTQYGIGDQVRLFGDPSYVFTCTTKGYSSDTAAPVLFTAPNLWQTGITETLSGTQIAASKTAAVWRAEIHCGVAVYVTARLSNLYEGGSVTRIAGYGVHIQADILNTTFQGAASMASVQRNTAILTGGGIVIKGFDTNGIGIIGPNYADGQGVNQDGDIGIGFEDHSAGGATWVQCYVEGGSGPGFYIHTNTGGLLLKCTSENPISSVYRGACTVIAQSDAPGAIRDTTVTYISATEFGANMSTRDFSAPNAYTRADLGNRSAYGFRTDNDPNGVYSAWKYDTADGVWKFGVPSYSLNTLAYAVGSVHSGLGPNLFNVGQGYYGGVGGDSHFVSMAYSANSGKDSKLIRGGARIAGDVFNDGVSPGDSFELVASTNGQGGPAWTGAVAVATNRVFGSAGREFADVWNDNGVHGYGWVCTRAGTQGAGAPGIGGVSTSNANAPRVWEANSRISHKEYFRPTSAGNGHQYRPKISAWAASTTYPVHAVVTGTDTNSEVYFVNLVRKFRVGNVYTIGDIVTPSSGADPQYGVAYQIIAQTDGAGNVTSTNVGGVFCSTGAEPTWPAGSGTVDSNTCRFRKVTLVSGATEPAWRTDYNTNSLSSGHVPDGTPQVPIEWLAIQLTTGGVEPTWATGSGATFADTPGALFWGNDAAADYTYTNGYGLTWQEVGAESATSRVTSGGAEYTRVDTAPDYMTKGRLKHKGSISTAVAGNIALNIDFANYEAVILTGAGGFNVTVSNLKDGNYHRIINTCALAVTILPGSLVLAAGAGATYYCDGTTLYAV